MTDGSKPERDRRTAKESFRFSGFSAPNYTQVPDVVFDELLSELSESELKVLLYIIRRTFGFKKESDTISLRQMTDGIVKRDGQRLDRGAGVSKTSAVRGVNGLLDKGIIVAVRRRSAEKGDQPTVYQLRFRDGDSDADDPVSRFDTPPPPKLEHPRVPNMDTQETVQQQTVLQKDLSKGTRTENWKIVDTELLGSFIRDYALEFNDEADVLDSTKRAGRIWARAGVDQDAMIVALYEARRRTQKFTGSITKTRPDGRKNKMPYFFEILESLLLS